MDFGHTFSRWLERHEHFCLMHGEAVAIDSIFSVLIAERQRMVKSRRNRRHLADLSKFRTVCSCPGADAGCLPGRTPANFSSPLWQATSAFT